MLRIALTGGMGSGKSFVCTVFSALGIPVFNADNVSKKILESDAVIIKNLTGKFGEEICLPDGMIDKKKLAGIVFSDQQALTFLNKLLYPRVLESFSNWCANYNDKPYVIKEAAVLFESGSDKQADKIITVICSEEVRISRIMERDKLTREDIMKRISLQTSDEYKIARSQFVIDNNPGVFVIPQVLKIHTALQNL